MFIAFSQSHIISLCMLYSQASLIRTSFIRTPVWEPMPIPQIQLYRQSIWERRCPDKWGPTVYMSWWIRYCLNQCLNENIIILLHFFFFFIPPGYNHGHETDGAPCEGDGWRDQHCTSCHEDQQHGAGRLRPS